ncbi:non-ribosomal peptide synthetase [Pseudonocardia sp. TRM90224]|uniref:non-ribosomal peptide synthetase n=1 Tax=Pseudonocardia sp. TRM90224 TaxID=2812678 RepID=UPI001E603CC8|nr:non-ribosomal peptide synthetase [Pseudonocardia sp. TRM90224]
MTDLTDQKARRDTARAALLARMSAAPGSREGLFPATPAQRGLWFLDQLAPGGSAYHMPAILRLRGRVDVAALGKAFQGLVDRHEALRTTLVAVDGQPLQLVRARRRHTLGVVDATGRPADEVLAEVTDAAHVPFDLAAGPLLRTQLWTIATDEHLLLVVVHHVMADGWSLGILFEELAALLDGQEPPVDTGSAAQPADLALHAPPPDTTQAWADHLADAVPPALPQHPDPARVADLAPACGVVRLELPAAVPGGVRRTALRLRTTEHTVGLAAFAAACHRMTGQLDVVIGVTSARRGERAVARTVGLLATTLPVRIAWAGPTTPFVEVVAATGAAMRTVLAHDDVPLDRVVQHHNGSRVAGRTQLLDVVFALDDTPGAPAGLGCCAVEQVPVPPRSPKFPLSVRLDLRRGSVTCEYDRKLLAGDTVEQVARNLCRILAHVVEAPEDGIDAIPLVDGVEHTQLVAAGRGRRGTDVLAGRGFAAVVADIAAADPSRIALVEGGRERTYGELVAAAAGIAARLRTGGADLDRPVAVYLTRGIEQVTACLAVLMAGGHYLPLDPTHPVARNEFMLSDAGVQVMITTTAHVTPHGVETLLTDAVGGPGPAPLHDVRPGHPDRLAMIGYTSGSTGQPKGYAITQRGIARLLGDPRLLPRRDRRTFLIANAVTFDSSTFEIWATLLTGGRGVVVPRYGYTAEALGALISDHGVTTALLTTQLFNTVVDEDPHAFRPLAELLVGGEAQSPQHLRKAGLHLPDTRLINVYGPAECSVLATAHVFDEIPAGVGAVPVGSAVAGTDAYVLDSRMRPVPPGAVGEVYIGGPGVAIGFVGRPGTTAERFVPSPFTSGARLYRSGDLARWDGGGSITPLGRRDRQIKIRGFRVEPAEVEAHLDAHPQVATCAVTPDGTGATTRLVAYIVPAGEPPTIADVRRFLAARLPDFMVPAAVVTLDRLPLTPNNKIDHRALPAPAPPTTTGRRVPPRTPLERTVVEVWAHVMELDPADVSVEADFFDLGGHSLLATRVTARLADRLDRPVPLQLLFDHPSPAALAEALCGTEPVPAGPPLLRITDAARPPLSAPQQQLWLDHQRNPSSPLYHLPWAVRLTGELDLVALQAALRLVARRHEPMRTVFRTDQHGTDQHGTDQHGVYQHVLPAESIPFATVDLTGRPEQVDQVLRDAASAPFDLEHEPPVRAVVAVLGPTEHVLLLTVHHIACDGWSVPLLCAELSTAYAALRSGDAPELPELPVRYTDVATWQRAALTDGGPADGRLSVGLWRWEKALAGAPLVLDLPTDRPRPLSLRHRGAQEPFRLDADVTTKLRRLARTHGVTPFMAVLAGFGLALGRQAGQDDLLIGTPATLRSRSELHGMVGCFTNPLILRVDLSGDPTVGELLERVKTACSSAFADQDVPFELIVERLRPVRDPARTPVFQVMIAAQDGPPEIVLPGLAATGHPVENPTARCDLTLLVQDRSDPITGALEYNTDLFEAGTAAVLVERVTSALAWLVSAAAGTRLSQLDVSSDPVMAGPVVPVAEDAVADLVLARAAVGPDDVAVVDGATGRSLRFGELVAAASGVASALESAGVVRGDRVGVVLPRSADAVVALLGVWFVGAAFVPLDPAFPADRLAFMAGDAGISALVADPAVAEPTVAAPAGCPVVRLTDGPGPGGRPMQLTGDDVAYVLYTSGSTGRPKGVSVTHRGLANLLAAVAERPGLTAADRLVAVTTMSFDMGLLELFGPLVVGGRVIVASDEQARDPHLLAGLLESCGATVAQATPATWQMLVESGWRATSALRVWSGGEPLSPALARALLGAGHEVWNGYGPTETTVYSTVARITEPSDIHLGAPVANTEIVLVDKALRPVPVGAVGEVLVGGVGVAHGYCGRPGLTAERFVPGPDGKRWYRTGDRGRWDHAGRLRFAGRVDRQVKVRGFRVEPGEVEAVLLAHPGVRQVVVALRRGRLVAWVVGAVVGEVWEADLRRIARERLPEYMVPTPVVVDELPLTPNGKIDYSALPDPVPPGAADTVPTGLERAIVEVWADVLGCDAATIGLEADFFEIGGHSLAATLVAGRLAADLRRRVPVRLVFDHPTVAGLAAALPGADDVSTPPLVRCEDGGPAPLSFAQQRLWFLHRMDPGSALYNVPLAVRLTGVLDVDALTGALTLITERHEPLRTVFELVEGRPGQRLLPPVVPTALVDLSHVPEEARAGLARRVIHDAGYAPFDLAVDRPLRATLVRLGAREHVLLVTVHHIAADGWSTGLMATELAAAYPALRDGAVPELPELPVRYSDVARWQRALHTDRGMDSSLARRERALAGAPAAVDLPTDHPRPAVFRHEGASDPFDLDPTTTAAVRALAAERDATPFMVLLTGLAIVLHRYTGQPDLVIGTPVAGRTRPEVADLVGFFANTLAIRVDLGGDPTLGELLDRVRAACLDAYGDQDLPFERLVEHLRPERDPSRTPIFQVMLALQHEPPPRLAVPGLDVEHHPVDNPTAKYDLVLSLRDEPERITGVAEYNSALFEPGTANAFTTALRRVLIAFGRGSAQQVSALPVHEPADDPRGLPAGYDPLTCLHDLVDAQIRATPDALAVIDDGSDDRLTYAELGRRADQIAAELGGIGCGIGSDELVAVLVPRSAAMVVALSGVLRAGAGVLPLDPEQPAERIAAILADAHPEAVVTTSALRDLAGGRPRVLVDVPRATRRPAPGDRGTQPARPAGLAYAIYTSGSTGRPKGVLVEHRAICNNLLWMQQDWPLDGHDRVLQKTTIAFDVAIKEVFWPLLAGAAVVLARPGGQRDPQYLADLIDRHTITVAHFVPSMLAAMLAHTERRGVGLGASLEKVMCGAETLPATTLRRFFAATSAELLHMYGPTETAIAVTGWTCPHGYVPERVPLGVPMPLVQLHLLDAQLRPVPRGAWGELFVGGTAVGRGYLGRPAETATAFVPDPFGEQAGARLYRTGDVVRVGPDGLLQFGGRSDGQVKIRGFRVEPGEIEAVLARHPDVAQVAVVAARTSEGLTDRLVAHLAPVEGGVLTEPGLRAHVAGVLPDYMVPARFVVVPALPLNASGKVDRARLAELAPDPGPPASASTSVTPLERTVATIVCDVLAVASAGRDDDLFELGGHSLHVPQVAALIAERTGFDVPVREIFQAPTIAGIARAVEQVRDVPARPITRVDRARYRISHQAGSP